MQNIFVVALVAAVAGFGGAWVFGQVQGTGKVDSGEASGTESTELLAEQIAELQRKLRKLENPPATLSADASGGRSDQKAVVEAVMAKVEARVDERMASQLAEKAQKEESAGEGPGQRRRGRKRVSLADAAKALELSGQEEDELRRIYDASMNRFLKLAAGPEGDLEAVKRDIESVRDNPAGARGVMMKYLPNMMKDIGEVMAISTEREAAVVKAVGADKARRLNSEFNVEEANPMGQGFSMGGGRSR